LNFELALPLIASKFQIQYPDQMAQICKFAQIVIFNPDRGMQMMQNCQPMKAQYSFYLGGNLGSLKLHGFINEMLRIP
jgi:hypothetical protein